jgi:hypothetical protein
MEVLHRCSSLVLYVKTDQANDAKHPCQKSRMGHETIFCVMPRPIPLCDNSHALLRAAP